jgi:hypothetical protein
MNIRWPCHSITRIFVNFVIFPEYGGLAKTLSNSGAGWRGSECDLIVFYGCSDVTQATGNGGITGTRNAVDIGASGPSAVITRDTDDHAEPAERCSNEFGS